ncbi:MAG: dihydropteroate synthase [Pirellulales bacterium]|nr:dihydropteroate synthase [Pirellulales bacterium]
MAESQISIISDVINNAYASTRRAFAAKSLEGFQDIARKQVELGASYLDVNIDGNQNLMVRPEEMQAFLPDLVPALQEAVSVPLCFDNPNIDYHRIALEHYDASKSGRPIVNSVAASRERLDEFYEVIREYDTMVIVMASEKFCETGGEQCFSPQDVYQVGQQWLEILSDKAGRSNDHLIIDTGLAPVGADTYGLVNIGLDAMQLISADPVFQGIHFSVGLSNFAWGSPKEARGKLERAYLNLAGKHGLDYVLANPRTGLTPLADDDPYVTGLINALQMGRPLEGESQEDAGFRQAEEILALF